MIQIHENYRSCTLGFVLGAQHARLPDRRAVLQNPSWALPSYRLLIHRALGVRSVPPVSPVFGITRANTAYTGVNIQILMACMTTADRSRA